MKKAELILKINKAAKADLVDDSTSEEVLALLNEALDSRKAIARLEADKAAEVAKVSTLQAALDAANEKLALPQGDNSAEVEDLLGQIAQLNAELQKSASRIKGQKQVTVTFKDEDYVVLHAMRLRDPKTGEIRVFTPQQIAASDFFMEKLIAKQSEAIRLANA